MVRDRVRPLPAPACSAGPLAVFRDAIEERSADELGNGRHEDLAPQHFGDEFDTAGLS